MRQFYTERHGNIIGVLEKRIPKDRDLWTLAQLTMAKGKNRPFPLIKYYNSGGGSRRCCETKRGKTKRAKDGRSRRLKVEQDLQKAALSETEAYIE